LAHNGGNKREKAGVPGSDDATPSAPSVQASDLRKVRGEEASSFKLMQIIEF